MKNLIIVFISILYVGSAHGQDLLQSDVPADILTTFKNDYPKALDIEWQKSGNLYQVEFEMPRNVDYEIWYDANGNINRLKKEITEKQLPKTVSDAISNQFSGYRIGDIEQVTTGDENIFKIDLNSLLKTDLAIEINAAGEVLSNIKD